MSWQGEVAITALVAALIELVAHYLPWHLIYKQDVPRLPAYTIGVAGFLLPITGMMILWSRSWGMYPVPGTVDYPDGVVVLRVLKALWVVVLTAGGAVFVAHAIDCLLHKFRLVSELTELLEARDARALDQTG